MWQIVFSGATRKYPAKYSQGLICLIVSSVAFLTMEDELPSIILGVIGIWLCYLGMLWKDAGTYQIIAMQSPVAYSNEIKMQPQYNNNPCTGRSVHKRTLADRRINPWRGSTHKRYIPQSNGECHVTGHWRRGKNGLHWVRAHSRRR